MQTLIIMMNMYEHMKRLRLSYQQRKSGIQAPVAPNLLFAPMTGAFRPIHTSLTIKRKSKSKFTLERLTPANANLMYNIFT